MTVTGLDPTLERVLDLVGVFVFALSGASLAVRRQFDLVGIVALATVTGLGGGMLRDVLLGEAPPVALRDQRYLMVPLAAALVVAVGHRAIERLERPVLVFDAAGLGLFCVVGTAMALDRGLGVVASVLLGVITAVGGGVLRDVLARDVPSVFRSDSALYAVPATLGACAVATVWPRDLFGAVAAATIASGVFVLRLLAMHFHWRAPAAHRTR
ncbi:MAG: trimeric intracellular cation channel family protein [Acidimicrobiales bacterium]